MSKVSKSSKTTPVSTPAANLRRASASASASATPVVAGKKRKAEEVAEKHAQEVEESSEGGEMEVDNQIRSIDLKTVNTTENKKRRTSGEHKSSSSTSTEPKVFKKSFFKLPSSKVQPVEGKSKFVLPKSQKKVPTSDFVLKLDNWVLPETNWRVNSDITDALVQELEAQQKSDKDIVESINQFGDDAAKILVHVTGTKRGGLKLQAAVEAAAFVLKDDQKRNYHAKWLTKDPGNHWITLKVKPEQRVQLIQTRAVVDKSRKVVIFFREIDVNPPVWKYFVMKVNGELHEEDQPEEKMQEHLKKAGYHLLKADPVSQTSWILECQPNELSIDRDMDAMVESLEIGEATLSFKRCGTCKFCASHNHIMSQCQWLKKSPVAWDRQFGKKRID